MREEAILLFGGTTEGRQLAALLAARGARVAVSVATPLGAEMLAGTPGVSVLVGRRDAAGMAALNDPQIIRWILSQRKNG